MYNFYKKPLFNQKIVVGLLLAVVFTLTAPAQSAEKTRFRSIRTQFIAAIAEPTASSGNNAQDWGIWYKDPGPRGVRLNHFAELQTANGTAPAGWQFNHSDWWLEEHGLIMEQPDFPLPAGKYLVTGGRKVTTVLTVFEKDKEGNQRWELADGTLYDVTHLACRSARYTPANENSCSPTKADHKNFPVSPGAVMPDVEGCDKQDYAVLFVVGVVE